MSLVRTDELLTTVEVARRLDVTAADVYGLILEGVLEGGPDNEDVVRVPALGGAAPRRRAASPQRAT